MASAENEDVLEGEGGGSSRKWVVIIGGLVLLSNMVWGAMYFMGQDAGGEAEVADAPTTEPGPIMAVEPMVVNLVGSGGTSYLRVAVSLELRGEEDMEKVEARMVPLRDAYLSILSGLERADVLDKEDKDRLRKELLVRSRELVSERAITALYFTEFMMQ